MDAGMTVGQEAGVLASRCDVKSGLELILSALGPNGSCSHPASPTFAQPVALVPPSLGWEQREITGTREKGRLAPCIFQP